MCKHAETENGLHNLMELILESMMIAERGKYLREKPGNKRNGNRPGYVYGKRSEIEVPYSACLLW